MPGPGRAAAGDLARLVLDRVGGAGLPGGGGRGHQRGGHRHGGPGHSEVRSSGHSEVRGPLPSEVRGSGHSEVSGSLPSEVRGSGHREVHLRVVGGDDLVILVAGGLQCAVVLEVLMFGSYGAGDLDPKALNKVIGNQCLRPLYCTLGTGSCKP